MKVLWLVNFPLPQIAESLGITGGVNEGWLTGLSWSLCEDGSVELQICYPSQGGYQEGMAGVIAYYGYERCGASEKYDPTLKERLAEILRKADPDVIHLMGSEYPHCWSMVEAAKACCMEKRIMISIQGLVSVYAQHYYAYMPPEVCIKGRTLRDFLLKTSLKIEQGLYEERGVYEIKAFQNVAYTMGRTEWDLACAKQLNPDITYFHGGETLRPSFYQASWSAETCEKHSLFVSQATYPIKGFHMLLAAMKILKARYSDCRLYVASGVGYSSGFSRPVWRNSQYVNYICSLMKEYGLKDGEDVVFVGALKEKAMLEQFQRANVFVSPSSIENSSNSVGEAMLLSMPVVASNVGGTCDILEHRKEGFLYPADEPYMLAHYVEKIFEEPDMAICMGQAARIRAMSNHNKEQNIRDVLHAYSVIAAANAAGGE